MHTSLKRARKLLISGVLIVFPEMQQAVDLYREEIKGNAQHFHARPGRGQIAYQHPAQVLADKFGQIELRFVEPNTLTEVEDNGFKGCQ